MIPTPQPPPITETMQNNSHGSIYSGFTNVTRLTLVKPIECRTRGTKNRKKKEKIQWTHISVGYHYPSFFSSLPVLFSQDERRVEPGSCRERATVGGGWKKAPRTAESRW